MGCKTLCGWVVPLVHASGMASKSSTKTNGTNIGKPTHVRLQGDDTCRQLNMLHQSTLSTASPYRDMLMHIISLHFYRSCSPKRTWMRVNANEHPLHLRFIFGITRRNRRNLIPRQGAYRSASFYRKHVIILGLKLFHRSWNMFGCDYPATIINNHSRLHSCTMLHPSSY